jgi:hypothetical protein
LAHQSAKGLDAGRPFASAHDVSPADVPGRQILQGATALILMFNACWASGCGGKGGMAAAAAWILVFSSALRM